MSPKDDNFSKPFFASSSDIFDGDGESRRKTCTVLAFVIHYARRKFPTIQPVDSSFFSDLHALLFFLSEQGLPTDLQGSL